MTQDAQFCNCLRQTKLALGSVLPFASREGFAEFDRLSYTQLLARTPELFKPPEVPLLYPAGEVYIKEIREATTFTEPVD